MTSQSRLKYLLDYNPDTGIFIWKNPTSRRVKKGDLAGNINKDSGYLMIGIDGTVRRAHRLAIKYMLDEEYKQVDHIDHNRLNNRLRNLRQANDSINKKNTSIHSHNTSGVMGVGWISSRQKFRARIDVDYKQIHLGFFDSKVLASEARKDAEHLYGFHANHNIRKQYGI